MPATEQGLTAAVTLAVVTEMLDPWTTTPPKVTIDLVRNNDTATPKWDTSWRLVHNLDHDGGGDTEHLEITCSDRRGLEWTINDRSGYTVASLIDFLLERASRG